MSRVLASSVATSSSVAMVDVAFPAASLWVRLSREGAAGLGMTMKTSPSGSTLMTGEDAVMAGSWLIVSWQSRVWSSTRRCSRQSANIDGTPRWADTASYIYALCMVTRCGLLHFFNIGCCVHAYGHAGTCGSCVAQYASGWTGFDASEDGLCTKVEPRSTSI